MVESSRRVEARHRPLLGARVDGLVLSITEILESCRIGHKVEKTLACERRSLHLREEENRIHPYRSPIDPGRLDWMMMKGRSEADMAVQFPIVSAWRAGSTTPEIGTEPRSSRISRTFYSCIFAKETVTNCEEVSYCLSIPTACSSTRLNFLLGSGMRSSRVVSLGHVRR